MTSAVALAQIGSAGITQGFKNRIINGSMTIDQRNVGNSVTSSSSSTPFSCDRWFCRISTAGAVSVVQSSQVPNNNFTNSMLVTVTTVGSPGESGIRQVIEGYNIADMGYGTANAQPVTVSFWVQSSVAGTYCFSLRQSSGTHSFVSPFTINTANVWQQITVYIPGPTAGTFNSTNGAGLIFQICLGATDLRTTTTNSWIAANAVCTSAQTNLLSSLGATFNITGVQFEEGTVATPFDWRPFTTELILCQRYFEKSYDYSVRPGAVGSWATTHSVSFPKSATTYFDVRGLFKVEKRSSAVTMVYYNPATGATTTGRCEQVAVNNVDFSYTLSTTYVTSAGYMARFVATANPGGLADGQSYMTYNYTAESEI